MAEHVLIERARRFPVKMNPDIAGWIYRRDIGAWVEEDFPDRLMVANEPPRPSPQPKPQPIRQPKPRPMSKKADVETGEDMKGE